MPKITPPPRFNCVQLSAPTLGHIPPYQEVQTEPPLTPADYGLWRSINTSDQMFQGSTVLGDKYNPPQPVRVRVRGSGWGDLRAGQGHIELDWSKNNLTVGKKGAYI